MTTLAAKPRTRQDKRRRRFAKTWTSMDQAVDEQVRIAKEELVPGLPAELVEIGSGLGSSLPYLRTGTSLIAYEPNHWFHERLGEAADEHGIELDLRSEEFGPGSLEPGAHAAIYSCLTLCSVSDIPAAFAEIERGLQPGGELVFIEHVAAEHGFQAFYQRLVRAPWKAMGDGCDPRSDFLRHLEESELVIEDLKLERLGSNLDPTNLVAWGRARKA